MYAIVSFLFTVSHSGNTAAHTTMTKMIAIKLINKKNNN